MRRTSGAASSWRPERHPAVQAQVSPMVCRLTCRPRGAAGDAWARRRHAVGIRHASLAAACVAATLQTGRERPCGTWPGTGSRSRGGVAHVLSAVPTSQSRAAHDAARRCAGTAALRHVSASARDGNRLLTETDARHAARVNRGSHQVERGKRLPRGLFPCLFRHSAAVCVVDQGKERHVSAA